MSFRDGHAYLRPEATPATDEESAMSWDNRENFSLPWSRTHSNNIIKPHGSGRNINRTGSRYVRVLIQILAL